MTLLENLSYWQKAQSFFSRQLYDEAQMYALRVSPAAEFFCDAMLLAGRSLVELSRVTEAIVLLKNSTQYHKVTDQTWILLAQLYWRAGDLDQSMQAYQVCLRLNPNNSDALTDLAEILRTKDHFEMALVLLEKNTPFAKTSAEKSILYHRLAVVYSHLKQEENACLFFEKSLKEDNAEPDLTEWEYSHLLLAINQWERGWLAYDHRFLAGYKTHVQCAKFSYPFWKGESLKNKTILIHGEQGLGDEIMFGQIVPELIADGAKIIWGAQPPLVSLFADSNPSATVFAHEVGRSVKNVSQYAIDYQVPVCGLARWKRTCSADFLGHKPGITVNKERTQRFASILGQKMPKTSENYFGVIRETPCKKVGIMWGANPSKDLDWGRRRSLKKSIPLELLKPLGQFVDRVQFVSLQNQDAGNEVICAPELDFLDFKEDLHCMADTAALITQLDLVITVDTSIAHLASAMHKETWILLMEQADWRWRLKGNESIWYPTATLFRQEKQGDWRYVVDNLVLSLEQWLLNSKKVNV